MSNIYKNINLSIDGMGMVIYSNKAMEYLEEGENFFSYEFSTPQKVSEHIAKGDIVGFNTGTGGNYHLKIREGNPSKKVNEQFPVSIRLSLEVRGNKISIIDLFWLMEWSNDVPEEQQIDVEEGIYTLTILTRKPDSDIWGDDQEIYIYLNKVEKMPILSWKGVPQLFY